MSTKAYGCFVCSGMSPEAGGLCNKCGRPVNVEAELRKTRFDTYATRSTLGRGFHGWTFLVEDEYQRFALKVVPQHRAKGPTDREARALVQCSQHRNLVRFFRAFSCQVSVLGCAVDVFCMVFDYTPDAKSLSQLIADDNLRLNATDVVDILAGIASGLTRMHSVRLWHDDLHDDNVLVRTVQPDENLGERFESKIIDFGSTKPLRRAEPEHGDRGDYFYLSKHIDNVVARFEQGNLVTLGPGDRVFAAQLRSLARQIADRNVSRRRLEPLQITAEIREALQFPRSKNDFPTVETMLSERAVSLKDPFDKPNALQLEPQDMGLLFIDELGWTQQIAKTLPVIISGPRGCGKTMLLRRLSIRSDGRPRENEGSRDEMARRLSANQFLGVLVSCGELRTPFFRSSFKKLHADYPAVAEDFCREYVSLHFALELSRCVFWLKSERLAAIADHELNALVGTLTQLLQPTDVSLPGVVTPPSIMEAVERRCITLSNLGAASDYVASHFCRDDVLDQLARALREAVWFRDKEIWFLLDDYSVPLLPDVVQLAYNPVLFRTPASFRLKLSSEGEGPRLEDTLGRRYKEGREFSRLNLGEVYFHRAERECRQFLEKVLATRFKEAGKGSIPDMRRCLGEHPNQTGFGRYIRSQARPGNARFYGFGLLCHLCSGDIGSILELFGKLYRPGGRKRTPEMSAAVQDKITKTFAHEELQTLRQIHECGPTLHEFALRLGQLLKDYLFRPRDETAADERLRLEIEGTGDLSDQSQKVHEQLLQHSVLVSGGAGKSRAGLPTRKYFFRRLYAPCFPFSPTRGECVALPVAVYDQWLRKPDQIRITENGAQPGLFAEQ